MSGRPVQRKADIQALQKVLQTSNIVDYQPLITYIMRSSGCTFAEIADTFGISRQMAHTMYSNAEQAINE